jgi:hypothetical protein
MFKQLLVGVLFLATSVVGAQRLLAAPDLSTLSYTSGATPTISVDPKQGWIYLSGGYRMAMGLARNGASRITNEGVVDAGWRPEGLYLGKSQIAVSNGDIYVHAWLTESGPSVIARYAASRPSGSGPSDVVQISAVVNTGSTPGVGAMYGGRGRWIYFTDSTSETAALRRIDTLTGRVDSSWIYGNGQRILGVSEGSTGALFVAERPQSGTFSTVTVGRLDVGIRASLLWARTYSFTQASISADDFDGVYIVARSFNPVKEAAVYRLNAAGNDDALWDGRPASRAILESGFNDVTPVGESLVVRVNRELSDGNVGRASVVRFDQRGSEVARWESDSFERIDSVVNAYNGLIYVNVSSTLHVLDAQTLRAVRALPLVFGFSSYMRSVTALPDGGRLFVGQFEALYNGQRFQNVLRTRADGTPDTAWRVDIDGRYRTATVTPQGILFVGDFKFVNGVARAGQALVKLAPGAAVSSWVAPVSLRGDDRLETGGVFAFDGVDNIYFTTVSAADTSIRRLSLTTGAVDASWSIPMATLSGRFPAQLGLDRAGGVWLFRDEYFASQTFPFEADSTLQRFSIVNRQQTLSTSTRVARLTARKFLSTDDHVYVGSQRYSLADGGQLDGAWQTDTISPNSLGRAQTLAGGYFYYVARDDVTASGVVRRSPLSGRGQADPLWSATAPRTARCSSGTGAGPFVEAAYGAMDAAEFSISCFFGADASGLVIAGDYALMTSRNDPSADKLVVEYLNRDVGRFFLTGMRFAAKGGEYRDAPEQPICRFYAAPESGGSNTHFYGSGEDCPALNTVRQLRFEGFDFAAIKPSALACPASAPNPVYRLFNNKSASNEGNHRYVVSVATKSRMIAQGWGDEGAVFCSTSVIDAAF